MSSNKSHHEAKQEAVERNKEKKEVIIKPRGMNIVWGNDARYWRLPKQENDPAELVQVCWLEVTCSEEVERGKSYEIGFSITLKEDAFGWIGSPIFLMAKLGKKGKYVSKKMKPLDQIEKFQAEIPEDKFVITVQENDETKLYFGLYEVWNGKWKGGLLIHHAFIREANKPNV